MKLKLVPYKQIVTRIYLNGKYLYSETRNKFVNPLPSYSTEELYQLSKCC